MARGRGRGIASSSTAVDAARAASSSASAASESCSSSDARAERTRRGFGAGASVSPFDGDAGADGTSVAARMASIRSAFRMRVAAFTPIAPAMVWSCSRSLLVSMDRSICCSGLICSLSRPRRGRHASTRPIPTGTCCQPTTARDRRRRNDTWNGPPSEIEWCKEKPTPGSVPMVVSHDTGAPENQPAAFATLVSVRPRGKNPPRVSRRGAP